jgi:short-subunit dehydrogenase
VPPRSLDNAVIAVVGASGGLGAPICRLLHSRGASVVLAGRNLDRLSAVGLPADTLSVVLDLRDRSAGNVLVDAVDDRHGRLDGLVDAAGVVAFGSLVDTDDQVLEELFVANVLGPLWLLKRAVPMLAESKGFVLHLSAVVAEQPMAGMAAYSASKAALSGADVALTRELRRSGIQVVDARPPHTETGLADRPLAGIAPKLPTGLDPDLVAARLVAAVEAGETVVPSDAFALTL